MGGHILGTCPSEILAKIVAIDLFWAAAVRIFKLSGIFGICNARALARVLWRRGVNWLGWATKLSDSGSYLELRL